MRPSRLVFRQVVLAIAATLAIGCASKTFRQGKSAAKKGDWDLAVARFTKAVEDDPEDIEKRMALRRARVEASRHHHGLAQRFLAADELEHALDELDIATKYDPANIAALDELRLVTERLRARDEERRQRSEIDELRDRARGRRVPLPFLSPRSQNPISLRFTDQSLQKVFEALAKLTGVNILFDPDYRDRDVGVALAGVTFEQALEQITFVNKLFFKVVDQNAYDGIQEDIALVDRPEGSCAIVHSDSSEGIQRLNQEAAKAMTRGRAAGMDITPARAIRW